MREPALAPAIRTDGLAKRYGSSWAVRDLTLTVNRGEIYGFLGPNGAGKTTTLLMLLGIERPTSGRFELLGSPAPVDPFTVKRRIGVVGEQQYLYDDLSAWEYLQLFGRLYRVPDADRRAAELLERLGLSQFRRLRARDHSRGMQQKLGLARALLHRPELLVLDEPVSGLDPHGIRQVRELLADERARGTTILISSHILSEVERTADRVGILYGGRLVAEDAVAAIGARLEGGPAIELDVEQLSPTLVDSLRSQPFVTAVDVTQNGTPDHALLRVRVAPGADHRRAISALVADHGALIVQMRQQQVTLEEAFVRLTADNVGPLVTTDAPPASPLPLGEGKGEGVPRRGGVRSAVAIPTPAAPGSPSPYPLPRGEGWRSGRLHAIRTLGTRDLVALVTSPGPYVALALGMLATLFLLRGHLDALARSRVLILSDAFSLPLFLTAALAMLYLALGSAASVAREREQGTLETLFYGPIDHASYMLAKHAGLVAAYVPIAAAIGLLFLADAGMTGLRLGTAILPELLLSVLTAAAVVALGLLLSTLTRGVRAAFALLAALTIIFLAVRVGSELLAGIQVTNNYSPLLFARDAAIALDRVLGVLSPFAVLENGVDAVVRADLPAYLTAVALSLCQAIVLLTGSIALLHRRGVRR